MQKDSVTALELIIVVVIIGILASIGISVFTAKIERTRGERAITNIGIIKDSLSNYFVKYGTQPDYPVNSLANINTNFRLELSDPFFEYIVVEITDEIGNSWPSIEATRNSSIYDGSYIRYDIDILDRNPDNWNSASTWPWMP